MKGKTLLAVGLLAAALQVKAASISAGKATYTLVNGTAYPVAVVALHLLTSPNPVVGYTQTPLWDVVLPAHGKMTVTRDLLKTGTVRTGTFRFHNVGPLGTDVGSFIDGCDAPVVLNGALVRLDITFGKAQKYPSYLCKIAVTNPTRR